MSGGIKMFAIGNQKNSHEFVRKICLMVRYKQCTMRICGIFSLEWRANDTLWWMKMMMMMTIKYRLWNGGVKVKEADLHEAGVVNQEADSTSEWAISDFQTRADDRARITTNVILGWREIELYRQADWEVVKIWYVTGSSLYRIRSLILSQRRYLRTDVTRQNLGL